MGGDQWWRHIKGADMVMQHDESTHYASADQVIDDKVAAETARCVNIVQTTEDVYDPGHPDDELMTFADFRRFCKQIISEIRGAN